MGFPNICIVGSGIRLGEQFTLETVEILKHSEKILTIIREDKKDWLPSGIETEVVDLFHLYEINGNRQENYKRVTEYILEAAQPNRMISYLTYGSPVVFDSVTQGLVNEAPKRGLKAHVFPSVSSIDSILVDLRLDMAPGIQIYEATFMVCHDIPLRPEVSCMLLQMGVFGSAYATYSQPETNNLMSLVQHLEKFYPKDHVVFFVNSQYSFEKPSYIFETTIAQLSELDGASISPTLYIPPAKSPNPNPYFLDLMNEGPISEKVYLTDLS